jgi:hypothetical protein
VTYAIASGDTHNNLEFGDVRNVRVHLQDAQGRSGPNPIARARHEKKMAEGWLVCVGFVVVTSARLNRDV